MRKILGYLIVTEHFKYRPISAPPLNIIKSIFLALSMKLGRTDVRTYGQIYSYIVAPLLELVKTKVDKFKLLSDLSCDLCTHLTMIMDLILKRRICWFLIFEKIEIFNQLAKFNFCLWISEKTYHSSNHDKQKLFFCGIKLFGDYYFECSSNLNPNNFKLL